MPDKLWEKGLMKPSDTHVLKVEISNDTDGLLVQMKVILGKSKSEVVQEALELYFKTIQSAGSRRALGILLFMYFYKATSNIRIT